MEEYNEYIVSSAIAIPIFLIAMAMAIDIAIAVVYSVRLLQPTVTEYLKQN